MFLSRDGDVRYYILFSVLHDRFVQDDFLGNIVFEVLPLIFPEHRLLDDNSHRRFLHVLMYR